MNILAGQVRVTFLFFSLILFSCSTFAQTNETPNSPGKLKKLSVEELMDIEVTTVSRWESTIGQSAAAIFVITQQDIRRSGAITFPELFRMVPGMNVARIDNNKWAVGIRGFNDRFNGKLLVQVDGRTVYNPLSSGVFWDAVDYPMEDIDRIEIIRGPGASVWGANAVNGIINIITKSAHDTQGGLMSAGSGTEDHGFGTFRYGNKSGGNLFYRVYGKGFTRDRKFSFSGDSPDRWHGASVGQRIDWRRNEQDNITFQGDFISSVAERKDFRPTSTPPFSLANVENEKTYNGNLLGRWNHDINTNSTWSLQLYWDHFVRNGDQGFVDLRWDTLDVDFQHNVPFGKRQKIVYGAGYRYVDAFLGPSPDNGFAVSFVPTDRNPQLFSAFFHDQIMMIENEFSLEFGSKFEKNDFTGFEYQPTGRLLWSPIKRQTIWAAISRAVRTPTVSEDGIGTRQLPVFLPPLRGAPLFPKLTGNQDFNSEKLLAYELGYRTQKNDRFSIDIASFYNVYRDIRVVTPGSPSLGMAAGTFDLPLHFLNGMDGETYGIDLAATWQSNEAWRLYGYYSYLKMNLHADRSLPASTIAGSEAASGQSPQNQTYLQSSWSFPHHLELDLFGRYVGKLSGFTPAVDSYISLDFRLGWQLRNDLEISLVGQNLLDDHHAESGTAPLLRSLLVEVERSVYGRIAWHF